LQSSDILKLIGKPLSDEAVQNWLTDSRKAFPSLEEGDYRTYIEYPDQGYCLIFTDEAMFLGIEHQPLGVGSLFLSGVFFYSEGLDGYSQFTGSLPEGLTFQNNSKSIKVSLGEVEWDRHSANGELISERWKYGKFKFHVTYNNSGTIKLISISEPDKT